MNNFLLVSSLAVSSTISAILTTQQTTNTTTTIIQLISISLITRLLNNKNKTEEQQQHSTRILLRHTIPTALLTLLIDCSKNQITNKINTGTWQAFDIYALPITLLALSKLPSIIKQQPSLELVATISITSFAISILFFAEPLYPSLILLALISPTSQVLYLIHLKTCFLSFPQLNPTVPLANSSPIALIIILIPTTLKTIYQYHSRNNSTSTPFTTITFQTILYLISRITERLLELETLSRFKSPLSLLLIIPLRNLLSIIIAEISSSQLSIGRLGSPQSFVCYSFSLLALYHAQPDIPRALRKFIHSALNKLSSLKLAIPSSESSSYNYTNQNDDEEEEEEEEEEKDSPLQEKSSPGEAQELIRHHHHHHRHQSNSIQIDQPPSQPSRYHKSSSHRYSRSDDSPRLTNRWKRVLRTISFGPLVVLFLIKCVTKRPLFGVPLTELVNEVVTARPAGSVDLVFSYYNEPLSRFYEAVDHVRRVSVLSRQNPRVIVYVKHPTVSLEKIAKVIQADEVVRLENVGREGGTYLTHILRHYNATRLYDRSGSLVRDGQGSDPLVLSQPQFGLERLLANNPSPVLGLADFTVFMQPEISWHWIAKPRMDLFDPQSTGFLSFGPYLVSVCGQDGLGNGNYERMRDIYTLFYNSFCPPTGQLASYAGQFVVSKGRILRNRYVQYSNMRKLLEAGQEHWIHREGGWLKWKGATDTDPGAIPNGPQAPFLGHALERSWPVIFHCYHPAIAELCPDHVNIKDHCQCID